MTNLRATFELHEACAGVLRRPRRINPPSATPPQPVERRARAPADLRALARPYMPHFSRATCRRIPRSSRELADRLPLTPAPLAQLAHASRMYGLHIFLVSETRAFRTGLTQWRRDSVASRVFHCFSLISFLGLAVPNGFRPPPLIFFQKSGGN